MYIHLNFYKDHDNGDEKLEVVAGAVHPKLSKQKMVGCIHLFWMVPYKQSTDGQIINKLCVETMLTSFYD